MERKGATARTARIVVIALLPLSIAFGLYCYVSVTRESQYLSERNLRELNRLDSVLKARIENYTNKVLPNVVDKAANDFQNQWPLCEAEALTHPVKPPAKDAKLLASYLKCAMKAAANLELVGEKVELTRKLNAPPRTSVDPKQEDDAFNVYIAYSGDPTDQDFGVRFRALLRMRDLLRGHRGDVFDELFIARLNKNNDDRVIFQRATEELRLDRLPSLNEDPRKSAEEVEKTAESSLSKVAGSVVFPIRLGGTDYKLFLHPLRLALLEGLNPGPDSNPAWALGGLVKAAHFRQESWAISNLQLLLFLFASALVITGYPLLKLWGLGPTEPLGKTDVLLAGVSLFMVSTLITYFLLDVYAYRHMQKELDYQLGAGRQPGDFASQIKANVSNELLQLRQLLDRMNRAKLEKTSSKKDAVDTSILCYGKDCTKPEWILGDASPYFLNTTHVTPNGKQVAKWAIDRVSSPLIPVRQRPYFQTIYEGLGWSRPEDQASRFFLESVLSWNTGEPQAVLAIPWVSQKVTLGVSTVTAKLISLQKTVVPAGFGFAVIENNGNVVFHSEARLAHADFFQECDGDRQLRSLVFARVDSVIDVRCAGRYFRLYATPLEDSPWTLVTFKDWEPLQTANLELLSASLILGILYVLIFLSPVLWLCFRRSEWSWPDKQRSVDYGILLIANIALIIGLMLKDFLLIPHHHVPAAAFLVPPFALLLNCLKLKGVKPGRWTEHPSFVLLLTLPLLLLGLGWVNGEIVTSLGCDLELSACLALSLLMCASLGFVFYPPRPLVERMQNYLNHSSKRGPRSGSAYLWLGLSIVVLVSVIPALAFFRSAHDSEMEVVVKHGQYLLARSLAERDQRIRLEYQDVLKPTNFVDTRLSDHSDVYATFFYETAETHYAVATKERDKPHLFDELMERIRPVYSDAGVETHEFLRDTTTDLSIEWWPVAATASQTATGAVTCGPPSDYAHVHRLIMFLSKKGTTQGLTTLANLQLTSLVPVLRWPNTFSCWVVMLVATPVFLLCIYALVRWVTERIFLFGLSVNAIAKVAVCDLGNVTDNTLVLGLPHSGKSKLLARSDFFLLDLRQIASSNTWDQALSKELPIETRVIAIDHLEYEMRNPECNSRKLVLLEKLLYSSRTLVVASIADPMDFPIRTAAKKEKTDESTKNQDPKENKSEGVSNGLNAEAVNADGWAACWCTFTRRLYVAKGEKGAAIDERAFKEAVGRAGLPPLSAVALLHECRSTERLRQIGIDIAALPVHDEFDVPQVIAEVFDRSRAYYRAMWATCSREEKSALIDLAQDGFANAKNAGLRRLLERGLAVRKPELGCFNESFRKFVLETELREGLQLFTDDEGSYWRVIRSTLLFAIIAGGFIVYLTQPQLLNSSTAFIGAIAAGIPALLKVFDLFRGGQIKLG